MPSAGQFRDRVTFQTETRVDDGAGGSTLSWTSIDPVWGMLVWGTTAELEEAGRRTSQVRATLTVRKSTETLAITTADRARIDSQDYQILSIVKTGIHDEWLRMELERGVAT